MDCSALALTPFITLNKHNCSSSSSSDLNLRTYLLHFLCGPLAV